MMEAFALTSFESGMEEQRLFYSWDGSGYPFMAQEHTSRGLFPGAGIFYSPAKAI
jgi:hypothetical protein